MDKILQYSEVTVSVRFDREIYSTDRVDHPHVTGEVNLECTYWIGEGGSGTGGEVDYTTLSWIDETEQYMLTTNAEDIAEFDDYGEAEEEIIDRLTSQFRKRLQEALHID